MKYLRYPFARQIGLELPRFSGVRMRVGSRLKSSDSSLRVYSGFCSSFFCCTFEDASSSRVEVGAMGKWSLKATSEVGVGCEWNGCPQLLQNFASSRFGALHVGQIILPSLLNYNCFCKRLASILFGSRCRDSRTIWRASAFLLVFR